MRNNIQRTDLGSRNPFDLLKGEENIDVLNLDNGDGGVTTPVTPIQPVQNQPPVEPIEPNPPVTSVDGSEEEEEEELPQNAKVTIKTNVPKLLAERLKADGQLPEDFEVTDETTSSEVEAAYRRHMSNNVRDEVRNEELDKLKAEGYDEKVLKSAQKLHYGITEQEIRLEEVYFMLGNTEFDSTHADYEKHCKTLFQQYYLDRGLPVEEAQVNAERDFEDSADVTPLIQNRQNYFAIRAAELEQAQLDKIEAVKLAQEADREAKIDKIKGFLDKGVVDGVTYSKQDMEIVRKALFEKSEVIVDEQGKRRMVTPYIKKKYERERNEEQNMKDIIDFILGYDVAAISEKERRKARKAIVDDLNDMIEVSVEVTDPLKPKPNPNQPVIERRALG